MKYILAEKLIAEIERLLAKAKDDEKKAFAKKDAAYHLAAVTKTAVCVKIKKLISTLQQEQPNNMIQWTGDNLKEVIDFTGKSPRFGEWFNSWEEYENYVHTHNDILKLFYEDGSHYEVPVGAWIVKTPDGYNVPSIARFIHAKQEQSEVDLEEEIAEWIPTHIRGGEAWKESKAAVIEWAGIVAKHFYELGKNAK